eukprot:COSAG06_NODE_26167_length_620_cov_0.992322_2_plen_88_part_01
MLVLNIAWTPTSKCLSRSLASDNGQEPSTHVAVAAAAAAPHLAEYICVSRGAVLRETAELSSRKVGRLSRGETVAVVKQAGVRLKCVR